MPARAGTGPRALALDIVLRVVRGAYLTPTLDRALRDAGLPRREGALVTDLAYGAVRHRVWLDAALAPHLRDPDGLPNDVREALRLGAYERLVRGTPPHAAANEWVAEVRRRRPSLAGLVNAVLRKVRAPEDPDAATATSLPAWLYREIARTLGARADGAIDAMREPAPLWLTAYAADAAERLRAEGCDVAEGPLQGTLRVRPSAPLASLRTYRDGAVQPQNPASVWVVRAASPPSGARVLDLASGRGIKAAALAAAGARVTAVERDPAKIAAAQRNLRRLGLEVDHQRADLRSWPGEVPPAPHVLLDAPCSGTGTLRAHPEIPLRLTAESIGELARLQRQLLDTAAHLTEQGGVLTYAVCSLIAAEGEEAATSFLARHPAFRPEPLTPPLPHAPRHPGVVIVPEGGLDGFFVARLRKGES